MLFSRTANEILRGMWFIDPQTALNYSPLVFNVLEKKATDFDPRPQAVAVRQTISPDGMNVHPDDDAPDGSIGVVAIHGAMIKHGDLCSWGADELVAMAQEFDNDPKIIGQIWKMDSGGGSVAAIAPYLDFLKSKRKPVVTLSEMSASANYYIASSTDHIMAENNISSMFGSIGVMVQFADMMKYYEEKGIKVHTIYADQSEHKNQAFEEALKGNYELIRKEALNPLAIQFQEHVKSNRPDLKQIEGVLTGKMFFASDALKLGLIDSIGNIDAAIEKVKFLASASSFINEY